VSGNVTKSDNEKAGAETRTKAGAAKPLSPAARRALAEAAARRAAAEVASNPAPKEIGGPSGPDPARYGDWERKGITSDF
jgi:hypothetical protein